MRPDVISCVVEAVSDILHERSESRPERMKRLTAEQEQLQLDVNNLIEFAARNRDPMGLIVAKLREKQDRLSAVRGQLQRERDAGDGTVVNVTPGDVSSRLARLDRMVTCDVPAARAELRKFAGSFELIPGEEPGKKCFDASGKIKPKRYLG